MKNFKFSILNSKKTTAEAGFSIVEVLIASFVFSILAIEIGSIFVQVLNFERRDFAVQKIEENALLVTEEVARDIRVSNIENQESLNCSATTLTMNHPIKGVVIYRLNNGVVEKSEGGGAYAAISNSNVNFYKLNFCIKGSGINDNLTARVAILATIQNTTGTVYPVNVETTVASRNLADELQFP